MPASKSAPKPPPATPKKLYRAESDRMVAGVAGGLAEYFNLDPAIIRILLILLTIFGGYGIIIYLILWLVLPDQSHSQRSPQKTIEANVLELKTKATSLTQETGQKNSKALWGLMLIFMGLYFLAQNFGFHWFTNLNQFWPLIFVFVGIMILIR